MKSSRIFRVSFVSLISTTQSTQVSQLVSLNMAVEKPQRGLLSITKAMSRSRIPKWRRGMETINSQFSEDSKAGFRSLSSNKGVQSKSFAIERVQQSCGYWLILMSLDWSFHIVKAWCGPNAVKIGMHSNINAFSKNAVQACPFSIALLSQFLSASELFLIHRTWR